MNPFYSFAAFAGAASDLAEVFERLQMERLPLWWLLLASRQEDECARRLLPRNQPWLRDELPKIIVRMHRRASCILRDDDDADDAVSQALIRTEGKPYIPENVEAYLLSAVTYVAFGMLRRRRARSTPAVCLEMEDEDDSLSPLEEAIRAQEATVLDKAVSDLPRDQRDAVAHHYLEDLSIAETAAALSVDTHKAQNILFRARRNLDERLHSRLERPANEMRRRRSRAHPPRSPNGDFSGDVNV